MNALLKHGCHPLYNRYAVSLNIAGLLICFLSLLSSCQSDSNRIETSDWRAELHLPDAILPFNFRFIEHVSTEPEFHIRNGEELISCHILSNTTDSLIVGLPVYNSELRFKKDAGEMLGTWNNLAKGKDYVIPLSARKGVESRFDHQATKNEFSVDGDWQVEFFKDEDSSSAIGRFSMNDDILLGTFLTPTGDYRFLEGIIDGDSLFLSCFDGAHAFLFKAGIGRDNVLRGEFWSGSHWKEQWTGKRNPEFSLPDPDSLTYITESNLLESLCFTSFGEDTICLDDGRYDNKVLIIQILGSWCPNCRDESELYTKFYSTYRDSGLEIIGIAFERSEDLNVAKQAVEKMRKDLSIEYDLAYGGIAKKSVASEKFNMLNKVISFPTSIVLDKHGNVRRIHTGFNGPATGAPYEEFKQSMVFLLEELLAES